MISLSRAGIMSTYVYALVLLVNSSITTIATCVTQDDGASRIEGNWLRVSSADVNAVLQSGRGIEPRMLEVRSWHFNEHRRLASLLESGQITAVEFDLRNKQLEDEFLSRNSAIAGSERLAEALQQAIIGRLTAYVSHGAGQGDVSFLTHTELATRLGLNSEQRQRIEKLRADLELKRVEQQSDLSRDLSQLYRDHCQKIVAVLNTHQRDKFYELIGQPLAWFELPRETLESISETSQRLHIGRASHSTTREDIQNANERRLEHNRASGDEIPEHIDYILTVFLQDTYFLKELELDAEQSKSIDVFLRNVRNFCTIGTTEHFERTQSLLQGTAEYPKPVIDALLRRQTDWLRQAELQIRLAHAFTSCGLLTDELGDVLEIERAQRDRIGELTHNFEKMVDERRVASRDSYVDEAESCYNSMLGVLTSSQRRTYADLIGIGGPVLIGEDK